MTYLGMSEEAKSRMRQNGMTPASDGSKPRGKAKSWNLIWIRGKMRLNIVSNLPYAMCKARENKLKKEPQYRGGKFKIEGNY